MAKHTALIVCAIFLTLAASTPGWSQLNIRFKNISIDQGLSQSSVFELMQDHQGYLWVGTNDGLNRYDGQTITVYQPVQGDEFSISGRSIRIIHEDEQQRLWVGGPDGDFNLFDKKHGRFIRYAMPDNLKPVSLAPDGKGGFYLGTMEGFLLNFSPESGETRKCALIKSDNQMGAPVTNIVQGNDGLLWVGTQTAGFWRYDPTTKETIPWQNQDGDKVRCQAMYETFLDSRGIYWFGTSNGLFKYDPSTDHLRHFRHQPGKSNGLLSPLIRQVMEDTSGRLWLAMGNGLALFDRDTEEFITYVNDPSDPSSIASSKVMNLCQSRDGMIWAGTSGAGLVMFHPSTFLFEHHRAGSKGEHNLSDNTVWAFAQDAQNTLWLGTENGLNAKLYGEHTFRKWFHNPTDTNSLSNNVVRSVIPTGEGKLWLGTMGGLNLLDVATNQFTHFRYVEGDPNSLSDNRILTLHKDKEQRLWIGTYLGGVSRMRADGSFDNSTSLAANDDERIAGRIWCLNHDSENRLWVGSSDGLSILDTSTGKVKHLRHDPKDPRSLSNNLVSCIFFDDKAQPWLSTISGLNLMEKDGGFRRYSMADGLKTDYIYGMLQANDGFLWLSSNVGLMRMNTVTGSIESYLAEQGLQSNEFNAGSFLKSADGKLFFGGVNGYNAFFPELVTNTRLAPAMVLTDFQLFNKSVPITPDQPSGTLQVSVDQTSELTLGHKDYLFSFEFAALDFASPEQNRYAYTLEGLDSGWIETNGKKRFATYTNLSAGHYRFKVKGASALGPWSEPLTVALYVKPPPWLSWWAIGLYLLASAGLVLLFLRHQKEKLTQQRLIAEKERRVSKRLRQVDKLKDEFLANTSHELRTPLNGIIGLAESLVDGATGPLGDVTVKNLDMIINSGRRLASLVDDILDFAKLKDRSLHLQKLPVDMYSLTDIVLALSRPLVGVRGLLLENRIPQDTLPVQGDENRLQQIMHNLVGNAVKFTEHGSIWVTAEVQDEFLAVAIHDTGIGIAEADLGRIFESFEQVEGDTSRIYGGTGLGLALTRQLVGLHGGDISVSSQPGEGSCFTFRLPLFKEELTTDSAASPIKQDLISDLDDDEALYPLDSLVPETPALPCHVTVKPSAENSIMILIVDDEPVNRQVLSNHLALARYEAEEAAGGAEALALLAQNRFDLVLLDIMMPHMNGYEVCRKLREQYSVHELPIIFLTARNQVADLKEGFAAGANDYLTKPIAKDELLPRIKTHLALLHTHRTLEDRVAERTLELQERNRQLDARNQEILRTRDQLILSEKMASLGTLTAGIAHEIRNPLTFINGFAEVSQDLAHELRDSFQQMEGSMSSVPLSEMNLTLQDLGHNSEKILEHGRRADQIVQNMIVLAKGEGGERSRVGINRLVHEFTALAFMGALTHLGTDLHFDLEEVYDPDAGELDLVAPNISRALINLVNNAVEALHSRKMSEGSSFRGNLKVWTQRTAEAVLIGFLDNGSGISEAHMSAIFTPFFTTKASQNNVGLGLSLCYEIVVREHGGHIDVSSEAGNTEVVLRLPINPHTAP